MERITKGEMKRAHVARHNEKYERSKEYEKLKPLFAWLRRLAVEARKLSRANYRPGAIAIRPSKLSVMTVAALSGLTLWK